MKTRDNITLYVCEFCNKYLVRKNAMATHELHCTKNPENFSACSGCVFLKEGKESIDSGGDEPYLVTTYRTFFCNKLNTGVYPNKAVKKGLIEKYPEQFESQIRMPTHCDHFELDLPF